MLEGKEVEGKIGEVGSYSVDVDSKGMLLAEAKVETAWGGASVLLKLDLIAECEKLAAKTSTKLDDQFIATLKALLGRA